MSHPWHTVTEVAERKPAVACSHHDALRLSTHQTTNVQDPWRKLNSPTSYINGLGLYKWRLF